MVRVDSIDFGQRFADSVPLSIRPLKGHSPALRPREVLDTERWKERACVGYYRSLFVFSGGKKRLNRERWQVFAWRERGFFRQHKRNDGLSIDSCICR